MKIGAVVFGMIGLLTLAYVVPPATANAQTQQEDLAQAERAARIEATTSLIRLELVLARKALREERFEDAARKALRAQSLVQQLPTDVDAESDALQAEGILARAQKEKVDVEALRRDVVEPDETALPPVAEDPQLDAKAQAAAEFARDYDGAPTRQMNARNDQRALRERAVRRQQPDQYGYRPSREIFDGDALRVRDDERVYYQAALEGAYRDSETQALIAADEARMVPGDVVSYPPDWPEKMRKREKYQGGMIARSPSWYDKDGQEWYVAVYDIHDLIYVPPDFPVPHFDPLTRDMLAQDRAALRNNSWIFRGQPEDLAVGIPLLRYFGGVDEWEFRGPKYSIQKQQEVIQLIEAFVGNQSGEAKIIAIPPER